MLYPSPLVAGTLFACLLCFLLILRQCASRRNSSINITLINEDNVFNQKLLSLIPLFSCSYSPPYWLKCSVIPTVLFGLFGRFGKRESGFEPIRKKIKLPDGTDSVFDLYLEPPAEDPLLENVMLVVVPGLSNHSQSNYISSYVEYSLSQGFKVVCYNHSGTLPDHVLTPEAPRFSSYGGTGDLSAMMAYLRTEYPNMKYIGVGFSLGANILLKYLGEQPERQAPFLAAQSWCQGYDAVRCIPYGNRIEYGGFLFNFLLAARQKSIIRSRYLMDRLFNGPPQSYNAAASPSESASSSESTRSSLSVTEEDRPMPDWAPTYAYRRSGRAREIRDPSRDVNGYLFKGWENIKPFNIKKYWRSWDLMKFDDAFTCPLLGFKNPIELYRWCSCYYVMDQIKHLPVLLVNARDDPLVPWWIAEGIVDSFCKANTRAVGVITQYGGHLGFFEGDLLCECLTWLDKVSIQHAKAIAHLKPS